MKKVLIGIIISLLFFSSYKKNTISYNKPIEENYSYEKSEDKTPTFDTIDEETISDYKYLKEISLDEYNKKIKNKESFILVVTQTSCIHCVKYKPILNDTLKQYNITGYEIDLQKMDEDERDTAISTLGVNSTPNTLFFIDGKEQKEYRLGGEKTKEDIEKALIALEFIEE